MKNNNEAIAAAVQSRMDEMTNRRSALVNSWAKYVNAVDTYVKEKRGNSLSDWEKMNIAQCLENALIEGGLRQNALFETTFADNITFLGIQLPVIAALLPSLVLNEIGMVQALDRRQGAVFYLDLQYGTTKGNVASGTDMINAQTGHDRTTQGRRFATNRINQEALGTGDGSTATFAGTLDFKPVRVDGDVTVLPDGAISITDGLETFTDSTGSGTLTGDLGGTGTITYATGVFSVTFNTAPVLAAVVSASYRFNMDRDTTGIGEVNVSMRSENITAEDFKLRANFSLGAAIDLEKAHGLKLESELVKFLGGEIKFEIDHLGIDVIREAAEGANAATAVGTWTATPTDGQEWLWKKYEFNDQIEKGSNFIFAKTLRGMATFILCGNNVARVCKQLTPHFKAAPGLDKQKPTGPMVIGTLDGRTVVQDPFLPINRYYLGFKGDSYLFSGFIYAPYIPLFATPTLVTADTLAQKGFFSAAGFKMINEGLYNFGDIAGLL